MAKKLYNKKDYHRILDIPDKEGDARDPFRRDLARLIHCPAFRRLQGKMQLFPNTENDFFRNRLTHSLEVSQIATGISGNLNSRQFKDDPINEHLVSFAALAHDIGHPPFGHSGELVLDGLMSDHGGFEGNAQTLRILCRIEKKETLEFPYKSAFAEPFSDTNEDIRLGLNLTMRSLASVFKYDRQIPVTKEEAETKDYKRPVKGYYASESNIVSRIKAKVDPEGGTATFKTIECSIMDLADDIAYSTYDLEDAFKAGFLSPIEMAATPISVKEEIASEINKKLIEEYPDQGERKLTVSEIDNILKTIFRQAFEAKTDEEPIFDSARRVYLSSKILARTGYFRTNQTSMMVNEFIRGVELVSSSRRPGTSCLKFKLETFKAVETLKKFSYKSLIASPMLKMAENRSDEIISRIFNTLVRKDNGRRLLLFVRTMAGDYSQKIDKRFILAKMIQGGECALCVISSRA
jgi:dGTPase